MLFQASELSCTRQSRPLFQPVSFSLNPGNAILIEGPNGVGKTTLLKTLCGLRRRESGTLLLNGKSIANHTPSSLSWLGHHNPLKDDLSALENLEMLALLRGHNQHCPIEALRFMQLDKRRHHAVNTFSAGMKRRLALASLLLSDSLLWILDEPQTALDVAGIRLFEEMVNNHLQQGGMLIMTSHQPLDIALQRLQLNPL